MTHRAGANPPASTPQDDLWTVAAIAVLASIVANVAHENIGHGVGLLLAGGRSGIFTTTRLIVPMPVPDPAWRIFDLGGPAGNLGCAALAWIALRLLPPARIRARLFCWLTMAFSLFWAFGYMLFSAVAGRGDWLALLPAHWPAGRILLGLAGFLLYEASIRLGARELGRTLAGSRVEMQARAKKLVAIAGWAGGLIAVAGAALDPRGSMEMIDSGALCALAFAIGLLRIPRRFRRNRDGNLGLPLQAGATAAAVQETVIARSRGWLLAALAAALFFVAVLGPGIPWRL